MTRPLPLRLALAVALAAPLLAPAADAQPDRRGAPAQDAAAGHQGFYVGLGAGAGRLFIDCDGCGVNVASDAWSGGTSGGFMLGMGGAIRHNVLLGGELSAWMASPNGARNAAVGNVSLVAQVYPLPRRGLFVRGGVGIGAAVLEDEELGLVDDSALTSSGFSVRAGIGYDVRFGRSFALAPFVDYVHVFGQGDQVTVGGRRYDGPPNPASLQAGLSFNWY